jgi:hypothetical protein
MQDQVGVYIAGLLKGTQGLLLQVRQEGYIPLELDGLQTTTQNLKNRLKVLSQDMLAIPVDDLTKALYGYSCGLLTSLDYVEAQIAVIRSYMEPKHQAGFKAQRALKAFLHQPNPVSFYEVGLSLKQIGDDKTSFHLAIEQIYARCARSFIEPPLADWENATWDYFVGDGPCGSDPLGSFKQTVVKRVSRVLFFGRQGLDISLEMLLYAAKSRPDRRPFYDAAIADPDFTNVLAEYDKVDFKRDAALLQQGLEVLSLIYLSMGVRHDLFVYAKACQRIFELARQGQDFTHFRSQLSELLFKKLESASSQNNYISMYEHFRGAALDTDDWNTSAGLGDTFVAYLYRKAYEIPGTFRPGTHREECQRLLMEAFLLRVVSACLYSSDAAERICAQQHLQNVLTYEAYDWFLDKFSKGLKYLMRDVMMNNIITGEFGLTPRQEKRFLNGAAKQYIEKETVGLVHYRIPQALFIKIRSEQQRDAALPRPFTDYFSEHKGHLPMQTWYGWHITFQQAAAPEPNAKVLAYTERLVGTYRDK